MILQHRSDEEKDARSAFGSFPEQNAQGTIFDEQEAKTKDTKNFEKAVKK